MAAGTSLWTEITDLDEHDLDELDKEVKTRENVTGVRLQAWIDGHEYRIYYLK